MSSVKSNAKGKKPFDLAKLAKFQRYVIFSILAMLSLIILVAVVSPKFAFLFIFVFGFQLYALGGLASQIGWHPVAVIFGLFFPLVNLAILLIGSQKATDELKKAGFKVGLLGVSQKQLSEALQKQVQANQA